VAVTEAAAIGKEATGGTTMASEHPQEQQPGKLPRRNSHIAAPECVASAGAAATGAAATGAATWEHDPREQKPQEEQPWKQQPWEQQQQEQ